MARILLVDDDPDLCFVLKRLLERHGHDTSAAPNGKEALQSLGESPFDIVITDLLMPEMDGIELIMTVRMKYPQLKVIAISGGGRLSPEHYLKMARLMKVSHIFQKPVKAADLLTAINDLLTGSE